MPRHPFTHEPSDVLIASSAEEEELERDFARQDAEATARPSRVRSLEFEEYAERDPTVRAYLLSLFEDVVDCKVLDRDLSPALVSAMQSAMERNGLRAHYSLIETVRHAVDVVVVALKDFDPVLLMGPHRFLPCIIGTLARDIGTTLLLDVIIDALRYHGVQLECGSYIRPRRQVAEFLRSFFESCVGTDPITEPVDNVRIALLVFDRTYTWT
jgi:hypothetical protein